MRNALDCGRTGATAVAAAAVSAARLLLGDSGDAEGFLGVMEGAFVALDEIEHTDDEDVVLFFRHDSVGDGRAVQLVERGEPFARQLAHLAPGVESTFAEEPSPQSKRSRFLATGSDMDPGTCAAVAEVSQHGDEREAQVLGGMDLDLGLAEHQGFSELDDNLLFQVFSFLEDVDLCACAVVCTQWKALATRPEFWQTLNFEKRNITWQQAAAMCKRYAEHVHTLNVKGVAFPDEIQLKSTLATMERLTSLTMGQRYVGDGVFLTLASRCLQLETLTLKGSWSGSGGPSDLDMRHPNVKTLKLIAWRVSRLVIRYPQLHTLSLLGTATASLLLVCPQLQTLDLSECIKLPDAAIRAAVCACPTITSLDVSGCGSISDETLREIASSCPNLSFLNASHCPNITLEGVRMLGVDHACFKECVGITSTSVQELCHWTALSELNLDDCGLLQNVTLRLPRLRTITFFRCRKLTTVHVQSPALTSLNVSECSSLSAIRISAVALTSLAFRCMYRLAAVHLQCPNLSDITFYDCDALNNTIFATASSDGGCPALKAFTLDSCEGVTAGNLHSDSLQSICLTSCRKLTSLSLNCPSLKQLGLDGCDQLQQVVLHPVGLTELNLGICPRLDSLTLLAPQLTNLELRGCGKLSRIAIAAPQLTTIDASYCNQIDDSCLEATSNHCTSLRTLVLAACPGVGSAGLATLKRLPHLTFLDLSYTDLSDLMPVFSSCPALECLHLSACKLLCDDAIAPLCDPDILPRLQRLDLSYCNLSGDAVGAALTACRGLVSVNLNGCSRVTDRLWHHLSSASLAAGGPSKEESIKLLESLSCVGCDGLRACVISGSGIGAAIQTLNLRLSAVRSVQLTCPNLTSLNLSDCLHLTELNLRCDRLHSLYLQACCLDVKTLGYALSQLPVLETLDVRDCSQITADMLDHFRTVCPSLKRLYSTLLTGCQ
eukprot:jgi/Chlat1/193/Chrsp1S03263